MGKADNHIRVRDETWQELNARKKPGDSFDDVIWRLLQEAEESEGNPKRMMQTAD